MKITSFNPAIVTSDPDSCIKLFEELGFERQHRQTKEDVTFPFSTVEQPKVQ